MTEEHPIAFAIHAKNHEAVTNNLLSALRDKGDVVVEQTDRGFEGKFDGSVDTFVSACEENRLALQTVCIAFEHDQGADGVAYEVDDSGDLIKARESRDNNPETWHGLVYDGLRVRNP